MESTSSSARPRVQVGQASAITPNQQPRVASHRPLSLLLADRRSHATPRLDARGTMKAGLDREGAPVSQIAEAGHRSGRDHGNRRGEGVALPTLPFAQMRASECGHAARLLRTNSERDFPRVARCRLARPAEARCPHSRVPNLGRFRGSASAAASCEHRKRRRARSSRSQPWETSTLLKHVPWGDA